MIRIHALHRTDAATNVLIVLRDTRWADTRQIIGTMEVDMSSGTQLVYMIPNLITSIHDFHRHIQIAVQTHGYEEWQGGESNLLITMAAVGRLSNTSYMSFRYNVGNVTEHLTTRGILAIPGERMTITELEGRRWQLRPTEASTVRIPGRVSVNARLDRTVSLSFERYDRRPQPARNSIQVDERDREILGEPEEEFAGVFSQEEVAHNPFDVCFCKECEEEAQKMADEPLNPRKRGNKPMKKKRQHHENWSTLGEPSGKFDYYVKYNAPPSTTPIQEIEPTGWDENQTDQEYNEGSRNPTKITIESGSDNESDYEPDVWQQIKDIPKTISEVQAKHGEAIYKWTEEDDGLPYPKFSKSMTRHTESAFPASSSNENVYNPPQDSVMGPPVYPPATGAGKWNPNVTYSGRMPAAESFSQYNSQYWTLPPAYTNTGVMLVLPPDPGMWDDVISRWESVTINRLNEQAWADNKAKMAFVENLLGENEKKMWQQWRTAFPEAYTVVENIAEDPQNITSQVRQVITLEDPYRGSTEEQDRAYRALERLTCERTADLWEFMEHFKVLAIKSGRLYFPTTMEKFFSKLPQPFSKKIEEAFQVKYPGVQTGVLPAIKFTHSYITDMCRDAALQKELRSLSVCSKIPIPGVYSREVRGRYGLRKARTYKGKPHDTHMKVVRNKYKGDRGRVRKCKCFVCGKEGHFARECRSRNGNMARASIISELYQEIGNDYDVVSADQDDSSVCSLSEGEAGATAYNLGINTIEEISNQEFAYMFRQDEVERIHKNAGSWRPTKELPEKSISCKHEWEENGLTAHIHCFFCGIKTTDRSRLHCPKCSLTACAICALHYLGKRVMIRKVVVEEKPPGENKELLQLLTKKDEEIKEIVREQARNQYSKEYEQKIREQEWLLKEKDWQIKEMTLAKELAEERKNIKEIQEKAETENHSLRNEISRIQKDYEHQIQDKERRLTIEIEELRRQLKEKEIICSALFEDDSPQTQHHAKACIEESKTSVKENPGVRRKISNMLYNVTVEFDIPGSKVFSAKAILDTGATACCIRKEVVPEEAQENLKYEVWFSGLNSRQVVNKRMKPGHFKIEGEKFKLPLIYILEMGKDDGIDMLIGTNFTRAMNGGIRIEGDEITIYKKVTRIRTNPHTEIAQIAIDEDGINDEEFYHEIQEIVHFTHEDGRNIRREFKPILERLQEQGFIGEKPMEHWGRNLVNCKLEIINPDITIQDQPLKHVTPALEATFQRHIKALLELGVIRPSSSRHRTMAMIVNSGTMINPETGEETKGKERMVFNYRTLNDNTYKDQYSLPGINTLLKKIGNAKVFSKFDLKAGFHQVAMSEESIPWTAFLIPPGKLYEWLVMPFGLKNAPAVFQRKMDNCFQGTEEFIAVYIDDILVYSENEEQHKKHLNEMLGRCKKNGLILSPTKMKVASPEVEFLGATIGNGKIKLQQHIIKKVIDFDEEKLKSKSGMRSFLGILNYARSYIPKLGILTAALHEKTNPHGDKRMKPSDYETVKKIKEIVQNLPDLEIPPNDAYIIIETDGCMEGWGGICKWKGKKYDSNRKEKVCAYTSGKFKNPQSTIDAEINACLNSLEKLKIYYLDKEEITLRTDCQAIISFHNKTNSNKATRVRWLRFTDMITGTGVKINIEHVEGKNNILADILSRLVNMCSTECTEEILGMTIKAMEVVAGIQDHNTSGTLPRSGKNYLKSVVRTLNQYQVEPFGQPTQMSSQENTEGYKEKFTKPPQEPEGSPSGVWRQASSSHQSAGSSRNSRSSMQPYHTGPNYIMLHSMKDQQPIKNGPPQKPKISWAGTYSSKPTSYAPPTKQVDLKPKTASKLLLEADVSSDEFCTRQDKWKEDPPDSCQQKEEGSWPLKISKGQHYERVRL